MDNWNPMLVALEQALQAAAKLKTEIERSRAIAEAIKTAAARVGATEGQLLHQLENSVLNPPAGYGDTVRHILRLAPRETAEQALKEAAARAAVKAAPEVSSRVVAGEATKDVALGSGEARGLLAVFQHVGRWICRRALGTAAAAAVGGTAATVIGGVLLVGTLAAVVYGVANLAGYMASDAPVKPGPAMDRPQGEPAVPPTPGDTSGRQPEGNAAVPTTPPTGRPLGAWKLDKVFLYAEGKEQPGGSVKVWNKLKAPFEKYDIITPTVYINQGLKYEVAVDITPPPKSIGPGQVFEIALSGRFKKSEADVGWPGAVVDVLYHWRANDSDSLGRALFNQMVAIKDGGDYSRAVIEVNPKNQSPRESFKLRAPSEEKPNNPLWVISFRVYNTPDMLIAYQYRQLKPGER